MKATDYTAIKLWGAALGSFAYYIEGEQKQALEDGAPIDAIYYSVEDRKWRCVSDLNPLHPVRIKYENAQRSAEVMARDRAKRAAKRGI